MAFENLGQHLGGYSGQMLQAAIAAREQSMKEKNMRLQAPLALAQTLTGAMSQWQNIEAQKHQQKVTDDKMTMAQELHGYQVKMANEEVQAMQFGNDRMSKFLQLELDAAGLNNEELTGRIAALRQATQFTKDMQPDQLARLRAEIDNTIAQGKLLKDEHRFNKRTENWRANAVELGVEKLWKEIDGLDAKEGLTLAQAAHYEAASKMTVAQYDAFLLEKDSLQKFVDTYEVTPEVYEKMQQWAHSNPWKTTAEIQQKINDLKAKGIPITAQTLLEVISSHYDPAQLAFMTQLAASAGRQTGKTGREKAWSMINAYASRLISMNASSATAMRALEGNADMANEYAAAGLQVTQGNAAAAKFIGISGLVMKRADGDKSTMPLGEEHFGALASFILGNYDNILNETATAETIWTEFSALANIAPGRKNPYAGELPEVNMGAMFGFPYTGPQPQIGPNILSEAPNPFSGWQ